MTKIIWTKSYDLSFPGKKFNVYITKHSNENYLGGVFYYTKTGECSNTENLVSLKFEFEQFVSLSEEDVYNQCIEWINNNLGKDYNITLRETKNF